MIARDDGPGGKRLVAYVVPASQAVADAAAFRSQLAERLPDYMVPSAFVMMDALPLTANGKLDRHALPAPERQLGDYRAPRSPEESALCRLFADVLATQCVGIDDNFFALGGDSIQAILLASRASRAGLGLTPRDVFEYKTVAGLSMVVQAQRPPPAHGDDTAAIGPISPTPLMHRFLERRGPISWFSQSILMRVPENLTMAGPLGSATGDR